jgi:hypothetical protein
MRIVLPAVVVSLIAFGAGVAQAQTCSSTEQTTLESCVSGGVYTCTSVNTACALENVAVTKDSSEEVATTNCCTKSKKSQRKACLADLRTRYLAAANAISRKNADLRTFLRKIAADAKTLRSSDCNSNAYNDLF